MEAETRGSDTRAARIGGFLNGHVGDANSDTAAPIADLFPHCTVFFGDIAGFTAWSSSRECVESAAHSIARQIVIP